jgi:hypothetical protein
MRQNSGAEFGNSFAELFGHGFEFYGLKGNEEMDLRNEWVAKKEINKINKNRKILLVSSLYFVHSVNI